MYSLNTTATQSDFQDAGRPGTLSYTLEDVQSLKLSTWTATSSLDSLSGVISQTGGGPAEKWDQKAVFLTRFFGTYYPFITFTTTTKVKLDSLSFTHYHNHNPGFPSNPSYDVQLQISTVKEWKAIGASFTASPQTHGKNTKIDLNGQALGPGAYTIRWIPVKAASDKSGFDTNTEFFAMDGISLTMVDSEGKTGKISYDIDDITKVGPVSTWIASSTVDSVTGVISQTGGGPAEKWDEKAVFLTRFLGKNYPFITVTATSKIQLNSLSFKHYHNHNVGYPSYPSYDVGLQLYTDDGWVDISSSFKANKETHGAETKIGLDGVVLGSGAHKIRWMPVNVKSGFDTNTEFFAMDEIRLEFTSFSYERDDCIRDKIFR